MRIACTTQGTTEWHNARLGVCRASESDDWCSKLSRKSKSGDAGDWKASHWNIVRDLAWERILHVPTGHHVTKPMEVGAMYEAEARIEFGMRYGLEVEQTGFVLHPTLDCLGASADGYVIENGIYIPVELKCPTDKTHKKYLEDGVVPEEYTSQMQTQMLCFDRAPYGYFASYVSPEVYPEFEPYPELQMFRVKLMADPDKWAELEEASIATMQHVAERMERLRRMYPAKGAPKPKLVVELEQSHEALAAAEMGNDYSSAAYAWLDGPGDAA